MLGVMDRRLGRVLSLIRTRRPLRKVDPTAYTPNRDRHLHARGAVSNPVVRSPGSDPSCPWITEDPACWKSASEAGFLKHMRVRAVFTPPPIGRELRLSIEFEDELIVWYAVGRRHAATPAPTSCSRPAGESKPVSTVPGRSGLG
ncbi:hypothetical protein CIB48_g11836 [Xylaria polymorpha]|nr:hypothetical protein CIB48_g11836 [Xylaria polymorpha]